MKQTKHFAILLFCLHLLSSNALFGQSTLDEIGIVTNFKITSDNKMINDNQLLVNRPKIIYINDSFTHVSNQWYNLEFETSVAITKVNFPRKAPSVILKFHKNDTFLGDLVLPISYLQSFPIQFYSDIPTYYYSINLMEVPITLLKKADRIEILILE